MNFSGARIAALTAFFLLVLGNQVSFGQEKLVILIRHAEKDISTTGDPNDPVLSQQGAERARRLVARIGKYRPGAIFSTDHKRTRDTVAPIAQERRKKIQIYDAKKPQELIDRIMQSGTKRSLIVGHSNTIPALANLIIKKEVFKNLDEPEHSVIWLIRIKNGRVTRVELLDY